MASALIVIVAIVVILLTAWLFKQEKIRLHFDKLGGPASIPILGNVHQLKSDSYGITKQLYGFFKEFGCKRAFRILIGNHPMVFVCCPEEAEKLLNTTKHLDKSSDYQFMQPWIGTGLLVSTGNKWKSRRKLLTPTFHFKILNDFVEVFNKHSGTLVTKLRKSADGITEINIADDMTLCALDIICETAMGRNVNAQMNSDSDYVKAVHTVSVLTLARVRSPWLWPDFVFNLSKTGKEYAKCLRVLHGFTEKVIKERQTDFEKEIVDGTTVENLIERQNEEIDGKKKRLAFLDMLLCAKCDEKPLSFLDIREEVDTFMFEGHDTTAMASNWAIHLIGADSEVQKRVHQELDLIFGGSDRETTMDDLKEMKYLECCIKESLRLYPSVMLFGRSLTEDCTIADVCVPKGTTTLIVPAAMHMRDDLFPDPEKFNPDRFLPENCTKRHPYAFIPFSAGSRNCIGQRFAILEEKVILSSVFREFFVRSTQERDDLYPMMELILRPGNGIKVVLSPRC
ncbi:cytochrome P450 4C1-like [Mya arenaria]|uniref:cytochrome P450 4C1-like n=1 Tax=Mya arenaria TaxID=6604 RepID=UPI0022E4B6DA|nr:cytochrome P450 4C1-like [Mya arenaria]